MVLYDSLEIVLACLYLRGLPRPIEVRRSQWRAVETLLRARASGLEAVPTVLRTAGFAAEALVLEAPGCLARAEAAVRAGRVLTAGGDAYPARWRHVLGPSAPPALWRRGSVPQGPFVAVIGSRAVAPDAQAAYELATGMPVHPRAWAKLDAAT